MPPAVGQTFSQFASQPHMKEAQAGEVSGLCDNSLSFQAPDLFQPSQRSDLTSKENQIPNNFVIILQPSLQFYLRNNFLTVLAIYWLDYIIKYKKHTLFYVSCLLSISSIIPVGNSRGYLSMAAIFRTSIRSHK